jgi:hypothetical protein
VAAAAGLAVGDGVAGAVDSARGAAVEVTPLQAGPTLVLAIAMAPCAIAGDCPPPPPSW